MLICSCISRLRLPRFARASRSSSPPWTRPWNSRFAPVWVTSIALFQARPPESRVSDVATRVAFSSSSVFGNSLCWSSPVAVAVDGALLVALFPAAFGVRPIWCALASRRWCTTSLCAPEAMVRNWLCQALLQALMILWRFLFLPLGRLCPGAACAVLGLAGSHGLRACGAPPRRDDACFFYSISTRSTRSPQRRVEGPYVRTRQSPARVLSGSAALARGASLRGA